MSSLNSDDIDGLLEKWKSTKTQISKLEKDLEKYKKYAEQIMNMNNSNVVKGSKYKVTKKNSSRQFISKKNLPKELWNKYSTKTNFTSYYLSKC